MVTTDDPDLAAMVDKLRNHGASVSEEVRHHGPQPYLLPDFDELGFNYRMTDLQGAVGVAQIARLDALLAERQAWAGHLTDALADLGWLSTPTVTAGCDHSWQSYVTTVNPAGAIERNDVMRQLHAAGISTRPGTHAVTSLGYYRKEWSTDPAQFPVASMLADQTMAIPLHNQMASSDYERVIAELRAVSS
jgi:dTDP-4-amino-4,6-dideoxygalactose transaminase